MANKSIQFKRGTAARWYELNIVLLAGQAGFEYDTKKMKIGDGITPWRDLPYTNEEFCSVNTFSDLPHIGNINMIYRVIDEKTLYQWNDENSQYESLNNSILDVNEIKIINGGNANG